MGGRRQINTTHDIVRDNSRNALPVEPGAVHFVHGLQLPRIVGIAVEATDRTPRFAEAIDIEFQFGQFVPE